MNLIKNRSNVITYAVDKAINNNLYISVDGCGEVVVKAPWYLSREEIQDIVEKKKKWILSKLAEYENNKVYDVNINENLKNIEDKNVVIFGKRYILKINYKNIAAPILNLCDSQIKIILPNKYKRVNKNDILKLLIDKMYSSIAEEELYNVMEKIRIKLGFAPEDIHIVRMKNILGKCNSDKEIFINPDIVKYDKDIVEYILLHEFCHIKYKNHSKGFKKMLEKYMPNYEMYEKAIKNYKY